MAYTNFLEKRKTQKYLVIVLIVVVLITSFVLWKGFFSERETLTNEERKEAVTKKINIDFELLDSEIVKELKEFKAISLSGDEIGRENPFKPY